MPLQNDIKTIVFICALGILIIFSMPTCLFVVYLLPNTHLSYNTNTEKPKGGTGLMDLYMLGW